MYESLLTRGDLARHFKVHPDTIKNWQTKGLITPECIINGRPRYNLENVQQALSAGQKSQEELQDK